MIEALIAKLNLWGTLSAEETAALASSFGPPRSYEPRGLLVEQGALAHECTLLMDGFTGRVTALRDGTQQITALHVAGDFVDLHSFLLRIMDHSVIALSRCTVASVPHERVDDLTDRFPHLTRLLWRSTLVDAAIHRQRIVGMGRLSAIQHLAHLICELALRLESVGRAQARGFDLPISQAVLADTLGLTSVHLNRTLQELRGRNLIRWTGQRLEILDWNALVELGDFDPTYLQLGPTPALRASVPDSRLSA